MSTVRCPVVACSFASSSLYKPHCPHDHHGYGIISVWVLAGFFMLWRFKPGKRKCPTIFGRSGWHTNKVVILTAKTQKKIFFILSIVSVSMAMTVVLPYGPWYGKHSLYALTEGAVFGYDLVKTGVLRQTGCQWVERAANYKYNLWLHWKLFRHWLISICRRNEDWSGNKNNINLLLSNALSIISMCS